jgi:uncharacterized metal-binding protein
MEGGGSAMAEQDANACSGGPKLVFSCSGAADLGGVSDQAARRLTQKGAGQMFCLAGIGGGVEPILAKTGSASQILAIDGCPLDCVRLCLEKAGFTDVDHLRVTDLGFEKGQTGMSDEAIAAVTARAEALLT